MDIVMPNELEAWIDEQVADGSYTSSTDVVRDALVRLRQETVGAKVRSGELGPALRRGLAALDEGCHGAMRAEEMDEVKVRWPSGY